MTVRSSAAPRHLGERPAPAGLPICIGARRRSPSPATSATLRVIDLPRLDRGHPVRIDDVVDRLNAELRGPAVHAGRRHRHAVALQSNWIADYRIFSDRVEDGLDGPTVTIEDSSRVDWIVGQAQRAFLACRRALDDFARRDHVATNAILDDRTEHALRVPCRAAARVRGGPGPDTALFCRHPPRPSSPSLTEPGITSIDHRFRPRQGRRPRLGLTGAERTSIRTPSVRSSRSTSTRPPMTRATSPAPFGLELGRAELVDGVRRDIADADEFSASASKRPSGPIPRCGCPGRRAGNRSAAWAYWQLGTCNGTPTCG